MAYYSQKAQYIPMQSLMTKYKQYCHFPSIFMTTC